MGLVQGGWGRIAAAAALVALAAALASAQEGPTTVQQSECWTCHREGGTVSGEPLVRIVELVPPGSLSLRPGEPAPLEVQVRNPWLAELHRIVGTLDLSEAPSLGFEPPPPPVLGVTRDGVLPLSPAGAATERTADVTFPVPAGATEVRIRLLPAKTEGPDAPDLELRLWPEGVPHDVDRALVADGGGKGEPETWRGTQDALARLGYGTWTAQVAQRPVTGGADVSRITEQPFEVVVDAWFNLTGDRTQLAATTARLDGSLDPKPEATLTWRLFVLHAPQEGESIRITLETVASYRHAPQFNAVDDWLFRERLDLPIRAPEAPGTGGPAATEGPTTIVFNTTAPPDPATVAADNLGLWSGREWGEVVGYFTTFLMASALVTGGVFGSASRRGLNRAFGTAARRVAFHNLTSYAILLAAAAHTVVFVLEREFPWTLGLLWGGLGIVFLVLLGVTGAWQVPLIRSWGYRKWRVVHYTCAILATAATLVHMALDGVHFVDLQQAIGWSDPVEGWLDGVA